MFSDQEWLQLVTRLGDLTVADKLSWSDNGTWVIAEVGDIDYAIGSVDGDDRPPFVLEVGDRTAQKTLARLESEPVSENRADSPTAAQLLPSLREVARRSATGAPQLFGRLIEGLNGLEDPF